jgi:hypothetical protein
MAKSQAENTNRLSVFFLKKHGYLSQDKTQSYGGIRWTRGDWENNINFYVSTDIEDDDSYIELIYTITFNYSGEKVNMRYKVPMTTTPCNYGGRRYWFKCSLYKNGVYCGRRVGVIYSVDRWFGCRYCANIAYQAQFEGGKFRIGSVCEPDVEKAYNEVKTMYYKGKPTKKHKRYLRLREKMNNSWARALGRFGNIF